MKKFKFYILVLLLIVLSPVFVSAVVVDRADYNSGLEKYKNKEYEAAFPLFEKFISEYPDSNKADDATWYLGRIYKRLDRIEDAENAFKKVLQDPGSNRFEEASYDLGKILYSKKLYSDVIDLISSMNSLDVFSYYFLKGQELSAKSWYRLGYIEKLNYNEPKAIELFKKAATIYEYLETLITDEADLSRIHYAMARIYSHLTDLAPDSDSYAAYRKKNLEYVQIALPSISDFYRPEAEKMLMDLERSNKTDMQITADTLAGFDNITKKFGLDIKADVNVNVPLGFRKELIAGLTYAHESFSFKTFNFDPLKTGDTRLIQSTDKISADIALKTGSSRNFLNTIRLDGDIKLTEDAGDNYYALKLSEDGLWRINSDWKTGWKSEFSWKKFPDYLIGGHKIDSIQGDLKPYLKWYFADKSDLTLTYGINLKQYLEAKYDTSVISVPSTKNRQYLTNSVELDFNSKIGSIIDTSLTYELLYLESNNYDIWISSVFMPDYNDYLQHTIKGSVNFQWTKNFRSDFDGSAEIRNYTNYIARDVSGAFLSGDELRKDLTLSANAELGFMFWTSPAGASAELIGQFWWDKAASNMKDEGSFDTNSDFFGGLMGVEIRLP